MPAAASRLRVLLLSASATLLASVALSLGPGVVAPSLAAVCPFASPCPIPPSHSPSSSPTASPSPSVSVSPTRTASPTASPSPRRTARSTHSPRPRATFTEPPGSTSHPVTAVVPVGPAAGAFSDDPSPTTEPGTASAARSTPFDDLGRLVTLVLGAAVLLGIGGATGLYLTRHPHAH